MRARAGEVRSGPARSSSALAHGIDDGDLARATSGQLHRGRPGGPTSPVAAAEDADGAAAGASAAQGRDEEDEEEEEVGV